MGVTCLSIAPFTVILAHWFERKRGTANGLAGVGIGLGVFILVPLIQYLISSRGWQFAFLIFSLLILAIPLPLNALFLKHRPQEMGLLPDGDSSKGIIKRPKTTMSYTHPVFRKNRSSERHLEPFDFGMSSFSPPS
jgi:MFS family permease